MKHKIALCANGWNSENLDSFVTGFHDYFINDEADLFVLNSHALYSQAPIVRDLENAIFTLPEYSFFDAVIIAGAAINSTDAVAEITRKCNEADVPVILQGEEAEGVSSVNIDNYVGMRELCDHLIEKHHVSDAVYIAGPEAHPDSNIRMKALSDSLEAHGKKFSKENIVYANWEHRVIDSYITETYCKNKKKLPDAFVCANDQMALSVMLVLRRYGISVPEDVLVSGFDNLSVGRTSAPSLASVDQSYHRQGMACAKLAVELAGHKKMIKKITIPCKATFGESCGCIDCKDETNIRKKLGQDLWMIRFMTTRRQGRHFHLEMCILDSEKFDDIQENLKKDFLVEQGEETEDFHLYVMPQYKDLVYMDESENGVCDMHFPPIMDVLCARTDGVIHSKKTMQTRDLFLGYTGEGRGKTYVFNALRTSRSVIGYMVMGYSEEAFDNKKFIDYADRLNILLTRFQSRIKEYNREQLIRVKRKELLNQTVEALASAVDAKDKYTHGHSNRVAEYSRKIAELSGMSLEECEDIYLAGLLHDVGKIGIKGDIINKKGKLTDEEFSIIKQHPVLGCDILSNIMSSPSLSVAARSHHERYDGKGYPDGLKGEEIPRIARIISVADAYDAMTSKRSYRDMLPRMEVREELVKGIGTQFDPVYARIMLDLIDKDEAYQLRELRHEEVLEGNSGDQCAITEISINKMK
ncbi:MAG: substrate-binding domain-containing protein [Clostridiales bacterium]|nr:substrate-binding domain-containing protein [Candidatus Blautia equi]